MKFDIGDKIRLRQDLTVKEMNASPCLVEEMWGFVNDNAVVTVLEYRGTREKPNTIGIEEQPNWEWSEDWFVCVEKGKIVLTKREIADKFGIDVEQLVIEEEEETDECLG